MDSRLPRVDGLTACGRINAADPVADIVVLTKYADPETRSATLEVCAVEFFSKENILALRRFLAGQRSSSKWN